MTGIPYSDWQLIQTVTLAGLLAWASGIRLYLIIFAMGVAGHFHIIDLPPDLRVLEHTWVLGASGFMLLIEFIADKVPLLDTFWDGIHTFIRIPAGALLAAGVAGDNGAPLMIAAGLLGGTITAGTHLTKAGARATLNLSPEPLSTWGASFSEDFAVVVGSWLAFHFPYVFLAALLTMLLAMAWLLPKFWKGVLIMWKYWQPKPKPQPKPAPAGAPGAPGAPGAAPGAAGGAQAAQPPGQPPQAPPPKDEG